MTQKDKILDRAQKFIQKGNIDKAIAEYKDAAVLDPKDVTIRLRLGELYIKINRNAEAIREYSEAAKMNAQRGFYLKAIAVYKQLLKLDDNLETHYKLADLYTKQRLNADAVSEYSFIVSVFEKRGKTNEVLDLLKKMVDIDPDNVGVRLKLADLYHKLSFEKDALTEYSGIFGKLLEQGKLDKAEKLYLNIYGSGSRDQVILKGLAELYMKKGDSAQFLKFARPLLQIYSDTGETEAGREIAGEILKHKPNDVDCLSYIERSRQKSEAPAPPAEHWTQEPPSVKEPSAKEPPKAAAPAPPAAPKAPVEEKPRASWPEEEIEITLEGFEDAASGTAKDAKEAFGEKELEVKAESEAPEVELEIEEEPATPVQEETVSVEEVLTEAAEAPETAVEEIAVEAVEDTAVSAPQESIEEALEEAIEETNLKISEAESSDAGESVELIEEPAAEDTEAPVEVLSEEAAPEAGVEETQYESVFSREDISGSIDELMEKAGGEAEGAGLTGNVKPEDMLLEPEKMRMEETRQRGKGEEYVDLSAELGMEETIQDLAGSWGGADSKETFDEFKSGIGQQLSKEDSETHYNLGIAYMEMELYSEAAKEFKIALKDRHLEFDCLIRLGLCAMADSNPREAITYYLKGLKIDGKSEDERMGMMYELALAYEAAGNRNEANHIFNTIYDTNPGYREVSKKVALGAPSVKAPSIPLDDGLIEVELL